MVIQGDTELEEDHDGSPRHRKQEKKRNDYMNGCSVERHIVPIALSVGPVGDLTQNLP